jgi:ABC-2 type transport system ATP-binding protein
MATTVTTDAAIATRALTKTYGERTAVDHLDLEVSRGEIFGLLGPNGAGKTTTILMLLGLTEPTSGSARVVGLDPLRQALEVRARVGYLPDAVGFYDDLTGRQNLRYTARLNRLDRDTAEARIEDLAAEVGLADRIDDRVRAYSRGMRQRLGIADALLKEPEVLVLDEPTAAIDPEGVREVLELIRSLPARRGCTVLLSSHLLQQVQEVCERVGIFVEGRLVASGTVTDLAARHGGRLAIEVGVAGSGSSPVDDVARGIRGVVEVRRETGGRPSTTEAERLWVVGAQQDVREALSRALAAAGWVVTHLRVRAEELAEVYHRYFADAGEGRDGPPGRAGGRPEDRRAPSARPATRRVRR